MDMCGEIAPVGAFVEGKPVSSTDFVFCAFCAFCIIPFKNQRKNNEKILDFSLQKPRPRRTFCKLKSNIFVAAVV